jgi:hypothetical protein
VRGGRAFVVGARVLWCLTKPRGYEGCAEDDADNDIFTHLLKPMVDNDSAEHDTDDEIIKFFADK